MRVALFMADPGLPWKKTPHLPVDVWREKLAALPGIHAARESWRTFAANAIHALERAGHRVDMRVCPMWEIDGERIDAIGADVALIPHHNAFELPDLRTPACFYMQMHLPWLFTARAGGWGAGAADYPLDPDAIGVDALAESAFERHLEAIRLDNASKYPQPARRTREALLADGQIPEAPFIFFPCQIPHDESVRFFSDVSEEALVAALARFSRRSGVPVVFKEHPMSPELTARLRRFTDGASCHWSDAGIHDLIRESLAVYTINSGVGFEALLHQKPVVTFGRADYDAVTVHGSCDDLDATFQAVLAADPAVRAERQRQFVDAYCSKYAIDLCAGNRLGSRFARLVVELEALAEMPRSEEPGPIRRTRATRSSLRKGCDAAAT